MSLAGPSAVAAAVALLVSGAALAMFFSTQIDRWGRLNDATTALFGLLMIPSLPVALSVLFGLVYVGFLTWTAWLGISL